jgi:CrcB protein
MTQYLGIAIGAAFGAVLRFAMQTAGARILPSFPIGTVGANLLGSFAFGLGVGLWPGMPPLVRAGVFTGFLGALTTFSSFSFELMTMLLSKRFMIGMLYWVIHVTVGVGCCFLGYALGGWLHQR